MAISWQMTAAGQPAWSSQASYRTLRTGIAGVGGTQSSTSASSVYQQGLAGTSTGFSSATGSYNIVGTAASESGDGNTASNYGATNNGGGIGTTTYSYSSTFANTVTFTRTSAPTTSSGSNSSSGSQSHEIIRNVVGANWSQTIRNTTCNFGITTTSSTTASGIASAAYTSGTSSSAIVDYRAQSTTRTTTRAVITNHSDSSLSSTTTESQTYTETIQTYETVSTTQISYVTASYITGVNHTFSVYEAAHSEFIRGVTASPTVITGIDALLGPPVQLFSVSSAAGQFNYAAAISQAFSTFTFSGISPSYQPETLTVSLYSFIPVTIGAADGWVGGTGTSEVYVGGICTSEDSAYLARTTSANTFTTHGRATYTTLSFLNIDTVFSDTVTGLDSAGNSAIHAIQKKTTTASQYTSTIVVNDGEVSSSSVWGFSVTKFISPYIYVPAGGASAKLSRLEKAHGYQAASALGSSGARGTAISANSSFYIGTANYVTADQNDVLTPFVSVATAETSNSSYSFSLGSNSVWSVSAARTELDTASTTVTNSTLTTFTASVGVTGTASIFLNQYSSWYTDKILGGANALTGINQKVTFEKVAGWKYTLKDATSTTAYTTHLAIYTTADIGTSLMAAESFSAASGIPANIEGPVQFRTFPFNQ